MQNSNITAICGTEFDQALIRIKREKERTSNVLDYSANHLINIAPNDFFNAQNLYKMSTIYMEDAIISIIEQLCLAHSIELEKMPIFNYASSLKKYLYTIVLNNIKYTILFMDPSSSISDISQLHFDESTVVYFVYFNKEKTIKNGSSNKCEENNEGPIDIDLECFFSKFLSGYDYSIFNVQLQKYNTIISEIIGYTSVPYLSAANFNAFRNQAEKTLLEVGEHIRPYKIINDKKRNIKKYKYVETQSLSDQDCEILYEQYKDKYILMLGNEPFAQSFMTSEWLYQSLKKKPNFDYTSVISGYLKSIEQLLYYLMQNSIDKGYKISIKNKETKNYDIIPFTSSNINLTRMNFELGTMRWFLISNLDDKSIFIVKGSKQYICDVIDCFRIECRNGYFHRHNLTDWSIVETTRNNALLLYYLILGGCVFEKTDSDFNLRGEDNFDRLCYLMRENHKYHKDNYIFQYNDGTKKKVIFDIHGNEPNYDQVGIPKYKCLSFIAVKGFSLQDICDLDNGIQPNQYISLRRDTLPEKIILVARDSHEQEIDYRNL